MEVENGLRYYVENQQRDLKVYTGGHGICELDDVNGDKVEIWLYPDPAGDRLPVPR